MKLRKNNLAVFRICASGHWSNMGHIHDEDILLFLLGNPSHEKMIELSKQAELFIDISFEYVKELNIPLNMDTNTYMELEYHFDDIVNDFNDYILRDNLTKLSPKDKRRFIYAMIYRIDDPHEIGISFEYRHLNILGE